MTTISQTIPSLGTPPLTTDPVNFDTRADTLYGTSLPAVITATNTWSGQANTVAGEVNTNASNAAGSSASAVAAKIAAEAAQAAAEAASNATEWVSGQAYLEGDVVWSPITYNSYRANTNTSGTTDPSLSASWTALGVPLPVSVANGGTGLATLGTAGQVLTVNSGATALEYALPAGGIQQVVTATTNTTLTSTKTLLQITPTKYGITVTLPDATTMDEGGPAHCIDNKSCYEIRVKNNSGTLLGFIYGKTTSSVFLNDNATSDGVWGIENLEKTGATGYLFSDKFRFLSTASYESRTIDMGGDIEVLIGQSKIDEGNVTAVAFNRNTGDFGAIVVIRAVNINASSRFAGVKHTSTQLLVTSVLNDALEAVVVSLNTTTLALTVNTAATATLSGSPSSFSEGCGLVAIPSNADDFVITYFTSPASQARTISISGTTPTISSAVVLDGTGSAFTMATADKVIIVSRTGSSLYSRPYTVGTATLTAGTGTTTTSSTITINKFFPLGSRWCVIYNDGGSTVKGGIISLASTTTTITTDTLFTAGTLQDAMVVDGKVIVANNEFNNHLNILTDSSGTASAGTRIQTLPAQNNHVFIYANGTDVVMRSGTDANMHYSLIDCSGSSCVYKDLIAFVFPSPGTAMFSASGSVLNRSPNAVYSDRFARSVIMTSSNDSGAAMIDQEVFSKSLPTRISPTGNQPLHSISAKTVWGHSGSSYSNGLTKVECV
jgi:hypothetical protein